MTPARISESAPHGKGFYFAVVVLTTLVGFAYAWVVFANKLDGVSLDIPAVWRLTQAGAAAICLLCGAQAFARLLAPARAQARSAAISGVARARLLGLRSVLLGMGVAASMTDFVVHAFRGGHVGAISAVFGVFFAAGFLVADFCGERW